ncbi:MAG TPA: pyridoxamine 5'-phosphate oxidase family protein [Acidimicrobiales bacterium]|nr:pyridoxamine 5'-phosphate oxidase family protein [Acidimicrobiales bacterium]
MARLDFDHDAFLARPLTARLATARPAVRPVWYLWEEERFWILVGPWNHVPADVAADPRVALVVDTCDLVTGECRQVVCRGEGELVPYEQARARRKLERYLGPDPGRWDERFRLYLSDAPDAQLLRITSTFLTARDLSFVPSLDSGGSSPAPT